MPAEHHFDTVAFDVRDNATMLFFAKTDQYGDIERYLLIVRTIDDDFDETLHVEVDEQQFGGTGFLREARLVGNTLTLVTNEPVPALDGRSEFVLTFEETSENLASLEAGAFRVLGDVLTGGNA